MLTFRSPTCSIVPTCHSPTISQHHWQHMLPTPAPRRMQYACLQGGLPYSSAAGCVQYAYLQGGLPYISAALVAICMPAGRVAIYLCMPAGRVCHIFQLLGVCNCPVRATMNPRQLKNMFGCAFYFRCTTQRANGWSSNIFSWHPRTQCKSSQPTMASAPSARYRLGGWLWASLAACCCACARARCQLSVCTCAVPTERVHVRGAN
jgi:hypothetical protein